MDVTAAVANNNNNNNNNNNDDMALRRAANGEGLQMWPVTAHISNKPSRTANKRWYSGLMVGERVNNSSVKHQHVTKYYTDMGETRNLCKILVGKSEGKRPLGNPRCRWESNIKTEPWEMRLECVD
jgi:hypothetical protein